MKLKSMVISSLSKVFSDEAPKDDEYLSFSMLKKERTSFQIALFSQEDAEIEVSVKGWDDNKFSLHLVKEIPSDLPAYEDSDDYFLRKTPGMYPDLLAPIGESVKITGRKWSSLWVELDAAQATPGEKELTVELRLGGEIKVHKINVEVIDAVLPEQNLICTFWFHCDCLASYYNVEIFSEEHWEIIEKYIRNAVLHGINFILTPLFTPPLDTVVGGERPTVQLVDVVKDGDSYTFGFEKLKRWVQMCDRCGVKFFEMSHLFTQWGALHAPKIVGVEDGRLKKLFGWRTWAGGEKYSNFLDQFSKALIKFIDENGIRERCYFHVSDEPNLMQYRTYKKRADAIAGLFPGFKVIDALSDIKFFEKGVVKYPIPSDDHADKFADKVDEVWTYYCCGQHKEYVSNRFFAMPSARNRILGLQFYKYNVVGFLQWGYNFWYSRLSKQEIDPYVVTDAQKAFPSGDAFVVYPGEDGAPLNSLRFKVFFDAVQDFSAMKLLETMVGRERVLEILETQAGQEITFKSYPHGNSFILLTRELINKEIKNNLK